MSRELREFDLSEAKARFIAFVPKGANKKQYFLVKEDRQLKEDILKAILETEETEVKRTLKEAKLEGEAAGVLEATAKILKAYRDLLPEDSLQILAKACGLPEPEAGGEQEPPTGKDAGKEAGKDAGKEAGIGGEEGTSGSGDPLNKEDLEKMDPKARSIIEKLLVDQQATMAEADEAKRIAKELKDQQVLKEYVAKAEELQNLPVQPLKLGPIMKTLGESNPREFEEIYKLLKAADAILDKSDLFREFGKADSREGSAEAQIYAKARALVAKDAAPTFEQAVEKVLDLEPELYEKAEEERQERIARRKGGR